MNWWVPRLGKLSCRQQEVQLSWEAKDVLTVCAVVVEKHSHLCRCSNRESTFLRMHHSSRFFLSDSPSSVVHSSDLSLPSSPPVVLRHIDDENRERKRKPHRPHIINHSKTEKVRTSHMVRQRELFAPVYVAETASPSVAHTPRSKNMAMISTRTCFSMCLSVSTSHRAPFARHGHKRCFRLISLAPATHECFHF